MTDIIQTEQAEQAGKAGQAVVFSVEQFEREVWLPETEPAARSLLQVLRQLDEHYGLWGESFTASVQGVEAEGVNAYLCTRLAGAIGVLLTRQDFQLSEEGYARLMDYHRWLALIFAVSSYRHADHIIRQLCAPEGGEADRLTLHAGNLRQFCLCYFPDSAIPLQPDELWQYDRQTVTRLFLCLISGRCLPTPAAHEKREQLLAWLPSRLEALDSLDFLPVAVLHDVYMHCSYADLPEKHLIKRSLNRLIQRALHDGGLPATVKPERKGRGKKKNRPVLLVVLEWFTRQHSVYRTHSVALTALRERFTVHAVGLPVSVDEESRHIFDAFHEINAADALRQVCALAGELRPDVVLYTGVGMFPYTIFLSNLRLAPLQLTGLGHGASTYSSEMDGFIVEEDFVGDAACFSETLFRVPADGMPFVPPGDIHRVPVTRRPFTARRQARWPYACPVRIAVCASVMKINPGFLLTLAEIQRRSREPVQFCFYIGAAQGLTLNWLLDSIHSVLPDAEVNAHMPVREYQAALNSCEMFVSPFPYGNMNGLVDAVRQGLPGVCLSGAEVHSHIDEGLFRRLGLPETLITRSREAYIRAVVRLVEEHEWRETLQADLLSRDPDTVLFAGHPEKFAQVVWEAYRAAGDGKHRAR